MKAYKDYTREEAEKEYSALLLKYKKYCESGLSLDLSRGKPSSEQLDVTQDMLALTLRREDCFTPSGLDCRNYGILDGLPEAKKLFSDMLGVKEEYIMIGGNSSLQLMYDALARAMLFGVVGSERPWCREDGLKWICITPGYDRHFRISETLGFELLSVPMTESGPDMDMVEELVKDPKVKGIWCVPKYSNPTGNTYSDETVTRLAKMECAAPDFRIMWDNAYAVHDLDMNGDKLLDIFAEAEKYGTLNRIFYFSSTSKISFPGAGVAMMAASPDNLAQIKPYLGAQTIGYDKLNQLRHVKYFDADGIGMKHMMKHARFMHEKFGITLDKLSSLDGLEIADWTHPRGGYFISLDVRVGSAKRVYALMKEAGVVLTPVGATFPYGLDPNDRNLRIAPSYPSNDELSLAVEILAVSIRLAALEGLLEKGLLK